MPPSRERDAFAVQQPSDDLEGLLEPRRSVVVRDAEGIELGSVPSRPHPQGQPAAAHFVDRRRDLGEHRRRVEVETGHEGTQPNALGDGGERREHRPRFPRPPLRPPVASVEVVLADPDRVESRVLGGERHGRVLGPANLPLHLGELDAESWSRWHCRSLGPAAGRSFNHLTMGVDSTCMTGDGSRVRACALLVVMTLLVGVVPASGASTDAKLHRAQGELGDLVSQIAEQAAAIDDLRGRVAAVDHRIDVAERALGLVLGSRIAVRDELEAAQAAYADAESRLHDTVVDAFMNSPGGLAQADVLGAFLQASSLGDLQDRLALGDASVADRERAVSGLATAKAALDARASELDGAL